MASSVLISALLLAFLGCIHAYSSFVPFLRAPACGSGPQLQQKTAPTLRSATKSQLSSISAKLVTSDDRTGTLPWKESVAGAEHRLLYMPFLDWQFDFMRENLEIKDLPFEEHLSKQESTKKPAVIESWQYESAEFRKIRLTYIDAGINAQVFNSVWYPRHEYDAPILGIDFLAFGPKKVLAILDLQPLSQDEEYLSKYIDPLVPIRDKYQDLCGRMSSRFYDEAQFFSKELLFGRFDNDGPREYDQYSAEKDPAVGLFTTYWGKDWAEDFTHNFLFSESVPVPPSEDAKKEEKASA